MLANVNMYDSLYTQYKNSHNADRKNPDPNGHIWHDFIYMIFTKGQNYSVRKQFSGCCG